LLASGMHCGLAALIFRFREIGTGDRLRSRLAAVDLVHPRQSPEDKVRYSG
jgi:hypothetical protein